MSLKNLRELHTFLSTYFSDTEPDQDENSVRTFIAASSPQTQEHIMGQIRQLLTDPNLSIEEIGTEANRWFADIEESRTWLRQILSILEGSQSKETLVVKDSNGTPLAEGDSVCVIKDLKVKGGSSDLKRGTQIKKIHLIDDPEAIECRVDGSTLVLKTCFLRKT